MLVYISLINLFLVEITMVEVNMKYMVENLKPVVIYLANKLMISGVINASTNAASINNGTAKARK